MAPTESASVRLYCNQERTEICRQGGGEAVQRGEQGRREAPLQVKQNKKTMFEHERDV